MALSALGHVERFVSARIKEDDAEFHLAKLEEKLYSGHRAFVLSTFVDSVTMRYGEPSISIEEMPCLLLALGSVETPLADAWRDAGRYRLVYMFDGVALGPTQSSWLDELRSGTMRERQMALIQLFRCGICYNFGLIGFQLRRDKSDVAMVGALRNLGL